MTKTQIALRTAIQIIDGVTANFAEYQEYDVQVKTATVSGEIKRISHAVNHILGEYEKERRENANS